VFAHDPQIVIARYITILDSSAAVH